MWIKTTFGELVNTDRIVQIIPMPGIGAIRAWDDVSDDDDYIYLYQGEEDTAKQLMDDLWRAICAGKSHFEMRPYDDLKEAQL